MPEPQKLLMVVLDSITPHLLHRWCADGTLPNIARVMSSGVVADTRSVEGLEVGATWPSFYTGLNPAGHGICWTDRVLPGTYREQSLAPRDTTRLTPFWYPLAAAGKRLVILDVPMTPPPPPGFNGIQVIEWGVHDGIYPFQTVPPELAARLRKKYGFHPPPPDCDTPRLDPAGYRELRDKFVRAVELRGAMTRELLAGGNWDFALQNFNEIHCGGHVLWHYHDTTHPDHDPAVVARDGDLLRDIYVAVDRELGALLSQVGGETSVLLVSFHSMAHAAGSSLLLPHILERLGAYVRAPGSSRGSTTATAAIPAARRKPAGLRGVIKAAWHLVPKPLRESVYNFRQWINTRWLARGQPIDIDPSVSRAFQMGFGAGSTYSGIRLNIKGREERGILARGEETDRFIEELRQGLMEVIDPETGRPLVKRLVRTGDLHTGARLDDLPDLLVEWHYDPGRGSTNVGDGKGGVWRGWSERIGTVEHPNGSARTGQHRLEGIMMAAGPGIIPGRLERVINVVDFAPTILANFGITMPTDGQVVPELVTRNA